MSKQHMNFSQATTRTYSGGTAGLAIDFLAAFTHVHKLIACLAARCQTLVANKSFATTDAMEFLTCVTSKRILVAISSGILFTNFTHDQRPTVKAVESFTFPTLIHGSTFIAVGIFAYATDI